MPLQCSNCAGPLTFDPDIGKLSCSQCGGSYEVTHNDDTGLVDLNKIFEDRSALRSMDLSIYTCSTCGGSVSVEGSEITSVCPFCGNTGVIFDRIAKKRRPDAVIPFAFGKRAAEEKVRLHLMDSAFLSPEQKTMKFRSVVGIYIPYYIIHGESKRVIIFEHREKRRSGRVETDHISKSTRCIYDGLTLEASRALLDEASSRIEPFDLSGLKTFEEGYIQGFCSDMADEDAEALYRKARRMCKDYEAEQIRRMKIVPNSYYAVDSKDKLKFRGRAVYALFPVWFVSGTYKKTNVTFIVNGQTGKVVGSMPYSKTRYASSVFAMSLLTVPAFTLIGMAGLYALTVSALHASFAAVYIGAGLLALVSLIMTYAGKRLDKVREIISLSSSKRLVRFAGRRELHDRT
ncbi:MAG: hypothetical protein J5685_01600 [Clostridiales bacterium]|nr:hypothetical protein [Clostridiales bacterium]